MSVRLTDLFEHVLDGEPALSDEVDEIFRRADRMHRRRVRGLLAAGLVAVAVLVVAGYLLATTVAPGRPRPAAVTVAPSAVPVPSSVSDPVLGVLAPAVDEAGLRIVPRSPESGEGWRQYSVLEPGGQPRGTVEVAVFDAPDGLCFPVRTGSKKCAPARHAAGGVDFVRYDDERDLDWQVHQTIARRAVDGRTIVVMATGERGTGDAGQGRPGLTADQVERVATDGRLLAAFGSGERCLEACPAFKVPI